MTLSLPAILVPGYTNAVNKCKTFTELINGRSHNIIVRKGDTICVGDDVYSYMCSEPLKAYTYDASNIYYKIDDLVVDGGKLYRITNKYEVGGVTSIPKEPEDYTNNETTLDNWKTWAGRYWKYKKTERVRLYVPGTNRAYLLYWAPPSKYCKGKNGALAWEYTDLTTITDPCIDSTYAVCLYAYGSSKYDSTKDFKAVKKNWSATGCTPELTLEVHGIIDRGNYFYIRTWTDAPIQYTTPVSPTTMYSKTEIKTPHELDCFVYKQQTNRAAPFDNKNYTQSTGSLEKQASINTGEVVFDFEAVQTIDTIAFGRVQCETISISVYDNNNVVIFYVDSYPVENRIAKTVYKQDITVILYTIEASTGKPLSIKPGYRIRVRLRGSSYTIGTIAAGKMFDAGFTNAKFENGYKDFSPKEQDAWGNIYYKNGVRVFTHSGTCDMPIVRYDDINRLFMFLGGQEVIINSSDSINNSVSDSTNIFQATMMIGRITSFKQNTRLTGKRMDNIAEYKFSVEESV